MEIIKNAMAEGRKALSEHESKQVLAAYHVPVTREILISNIQGLTKAITQIGFPLVLKGCSPEISHKTERGLIKIDIRNEAEARTAFDEIMNELSETDDGVLVQEMVQGHRELVAGLIRDLQFGPCVMFGLGGIFTEILRDITFRIAPIEKRDAMEMMHEIKGHKILEGIRNMDAVDIDRLAEILINVGQIGLENEAIKEIDINPLVISGSKPLAVDALIILE